MPRAGGWLSVLLCFGFMGCGAPSIVSIDRLAASGLDEPFPNASMAQMPGDYGRLEYDVPRAVKSSHWGLLRVTHESAGSADAGQEVLRAAALLPDGRTAAIVAWAKREGVVSVAVRVGHMGDRARERDFLVELASALRGNPSRTQRFDQTLPKR